MFYAAAMSYAVWSGFNEPYQNWDMLGYVGSVVAWHDKGDKAIYEHTMKTVKENVPQAAYDDYAANTLSATADVFVEQLPFYQSKPLYNALMWTVHLGNIPLPVASWTVSATAFAILSVLLFCWSPRYMAREVWLLLVVALTYGWQWAMNSLACLSTPDCLATMLIACAFYSWFLRHSFGYFCFFSWLAVLARPDTLILCSAMAAYCAFWAPQKETMKLASVIKLILFYYVTYLAISRYSHSYGLERWFIYMFIDKTPHIAQAHDHLTLARYMTVLVPSAQLFLGLGRTICMLAFSLVACITYVLRPAEGNRLWLQMMFVIWGSLTAHFLLFPAWGDDRFYFCYYLPILFAGGECIFGYFNALWNMLTQHRKKLADFSEWA